MASRAWQQFIGKRRAFVSPLAELVCVFWFLGSQAEPAWAEEEAAASTGQTEVEPPGDTSTGDATTGEGLRDQTAPAGEAPVGELSEEASIREAAPAVMRPPDRPGGQSVSGREGAEKSGPSALRYVIESVEIRGNHKTSSRVILRYFPLRAGAVLDVEDSAIELSRFRLLSTGFFRDVQFALRKGRTPGHVVFLIEVVERNTLILNDVRLGLSADADTQGNARPLTAYGALDVAELNLGGTGVTLGSALALGQDQFALQLRFLDPSLMGSPWMVASSFQLTRGRDFFGNAQVLYSDPESPDRRADHAVVRYDRVGGTLGLGRDLSLVSQLWLNYRLERVSASFPLQASHLRGTRREPIDFSIIRGESLLGSFNAALRVDTRDQPILPTRGWFASFGTEASLLQLGSDYSYQKLEGRAAYYTRLPWHRHVLKLEAFTGAISGDAPFFEQYYVGDFSDFLPARVLGMNFDRRPAPNFLGTDIVEVRYGELAAKLGTEYRIPLYQGARSVFGIDFFGGFGVYAIASQRDVKNPPAGYSGAARLPVDLTLNLGFRMDTSIGGFTFAFSNVLGFIPVRGEGPAGD